MWYTLSSIVGYAQTVFVNYKNVFFESQNKVTVGPMCKVQNLLTLTSQEQEDFLNSFDHVICDCDGVLWKNTNPITGVKESLNFLSKRGKKIHFLTNNGVKSFEKYQQLFKTIGVDIKHEDLLYPSKAVACYLKSINFDKTIYVISTTSFQADLTEAGVKFVTSDNEVPEDLKWFLANSADDTSIGAVLIDFDINMNYLKLSKAIALLKRPEVHFLVGSTDNEVPVTDDIKFIGPGTFVSVVSKFSGKSPIVLGKPGPKVKELIMQQFNITAPERVLFIGDSMETDMEFADLCKFQKLLVFSGISQPNDVLQSKNESQIPNYTLKSLADMSCLIK